jgi:hypothetical protein
MTKASVIESSDVEERNLLPGNERWTVYVGSRAGMSCLGSVRSLLCAATWVVARWLVCGTLVGNGVWQVDRLRRRRERHCPPLPCNTISGVLSGDGGDRRDVDETVNAELAQLPADMRARLVRIWELIDLSAFRMSKSRTFVTSAGSSGRLASRGKPASHGRSTSTRKSSGW